MNIEEWVRKVAKELRKHADRDNCYDCKQLLKYPLLKRYMDYQEAKI